MYCRTADNATEIWTAELTSLGLIHDLAARISGELEDFKLQVVEEASKVAFVATGKAVSNGLLVANEAAEAASQDRSSALLYDALFVRHWDHYITRRRYALFYGLLSRQDDQSTKHPKKRNGKWVLSQLHNALAGTSLESPIEPWPGPEHYDIGPLGIAFVAKDPILDPAWHTRCDAYFVPITDFGKAPNSKPKKLAVAGFEGAASSPAFSPSGERLVWLHMRDGVYESDKNDVLLHPDLTKLEDEQVSHSEVPKILNIVTSTDDEGPWDRSPSQVFWNGEGTALYFIAEDEGTERLFRYLLKRDGPPIVKPLDVTGSIQQLHLFGNDSKRILVSSTSFIDNSIWTTIDDSEHAIPHVISSHSRNGTAFALSPEQVSSTMWTGAHNRRIHAWLLKPPAFNPSKKYPFALIIHGGPQSAWTDAWSTRWNPAVFAAQGYIVLLPNPTGSVGFGQAFTDAIRQDWGGAPYEDLVAGMDYVTSSADFPLAGAIDTARMVALGASFGGFMINWMNGHELAKRFKALVCHDGVFSIEGQLASEEQYFPYTEFGGKKAHFWDDPETYMRWDPARFVGEWQTPTLVIHSEKDYRLTISEGLAAFNGLQRQGIESRLLIFPNEGHWVLKEINSLAWHHVVINWINKFTGLQPVGEEPESQSRQRATA